MKSFIWLTSILAVIFSPALLIHAGELKLREEYRYEADSCLFKKMDPNRFILVGYVSDRGEPGQSLGLQYKMFDMKKREFTSFSLPVGEFQKKFPALLGTKAGPQLEAYNGETSSLIMNQVSNYKTVAWYYCQYDHAKKQISESVKMGDRKDKEIIGTLGIDPSGRYFYFATYYYQGERADLATTAMRLARVNLQRCEIDWELLVTFKKRARQLDVHYWQFNHDGTKLALLEYNDRAGEKESSADPQALVYVVDVPSKKIDTYPIPLSPYGRVFTPDGKYLFIGSNEEGKIIRINLEDERIDLEKQAIRRLFDFVLTPNAKSLMIFADTTLVSPKVVEVRGTKDLELLTSIPAKLLMPGDEGASPGPVLSFDDGKYIVYTVPSGKKGEAAFRLYEVPEDLNSPKTAGTTAKDLRVSQGIVLAHQYADGHGIVIASDKGIGGPENTFACIAITENRIYFTGTTGGIEGDYKPGLTKPVVVCLESSGKKLWERNLSRQGFADQIGASLAVDDQGNCVAFIIAYYHPGNYGVGRFVKLNAAGTVIWETQLRGKGQYDTPLADTKKLLSNGNISITGRIDLKQNEKYYWSGEINKDGKVISDVVGERYE
jgi:hypothetical protein